MKKENDTLSIPALWGATTASAFITLLISVLPFGLACTLPHGILQYIAFAILTIASLLFFILFGIHAYEVEIKLIAESSTGAE
jgi:hypothetical protein